LVFKDQLRIHHQNRTGSHPSPPGTASFCVAASAAEKRDYGERPAGRQSPPCNYFQKVERH
ncbi:hypothetical protein, partial [Paraburkholderia caffeinilytica]|uniref:hypothetical protein n=1 Tax=Paraburkholderia caffeinilytica TaxID=1761016 RepID=UPI001E5C6D4E